MQVWNLLHAARWKHRTQKRRQKSPSGHHSTTLSGYIFATKARIDKQKKNLLSSNMFSTCPHNMVNFGLLVHNIMDGTETVQLIDIEENSGVFFLIWMHWCRQQKHADSKALLQQNHPDKNYHYWRALFMLTFKLVFNWATLYILMSVITELLCSN